MDAFADLGWVERAAARLLLLDSLLRREDALSIARALAVKPAWRESEPEEIVTRIFEREGRLRRLAKRT
jgi:hypothetical protein